MIWWYLNCGWCVVYWLEHTDSSMGVVSSNPEVCTWSQRPNSCEERGLWYGKIASNLVIYDRETPTWWYLIRQRTGPIFVIVYAKLTGTFISLQPYCYTTGSALSDRSPQISKSIIKLLLRTLSIHLCIYMHVPVVLLLGVPVPLYH